MLAGKELIAVPALPWVAHVFLRLASETVGGQSVWQRKVVATGTANGVTTPAGVTRTSVVMPGTASFFIRNCGTQKEWSTSRARDLIWSSEGLEEAR